jgi:hypothetical protein
VFETGHARRPPATLARNEFKLVRFTVDGTNNYGLKDSKLTYRGGQGLEAFVVEGFTRLKGVGPNGRNGHNA